MSGINMQRVLLGGLLAGLVVNVGEYILNWLMAGRMEEAYAALNLSPPGTGAMVVFAILGFVLGITMVWVYAAARPRLGPGPKSAATVAVAIWIAAWLLPIMGYVLQGMFSVTLGMVAGIWGFGEVILASVAGAWLYTEEPAAAAGGGDIAV